MSSNDLRKGLWVVTIRDTLCSEPDYIINLYQSLKDAVKYLKTLKLSKEQLETVVEEELDIEYEPDRRVQLTFSYIQPLEEEDDETSLDDDYPCKNLNVHPGHRPDVIAKKRHRIADLM